MNRQWRQALPPLNVITITACICYLLTYWIDLLCIHLSVAVPEAVGETRIIFLSFLSALYAYYRVRYFHPFYNSKYWQWLCLSPWSVDKPLPQGPVHLIWTDFMLLAVLVLLAYANIPFYALSPIVAFLVVYLLIIVLTFQAEQATFLILFFSLAPLTFYPFTNWYSAVLMLAILYIICYAGLYQSLKEFPWNTKYWKINIVDEYKKQAIIQRVLGWPFKFLNIYDAPRVSCLEAFILSLLLTWWLHAISRFFSGAPVFPLFVILTINVAIFRWGPYVAGAYFPPISLMGRIFTGRLIIPKYDIVFTAPICILLAGTVLPLVLHRQGLDAVWNFEICFFLVFFLAFSLPPTLKKWRLTGAYRIGRSAQLSKPKPQSSADQKIVEFFSAKFESSK
jgi:hypothetical protein